MEIKIYVFEVTLASETKIYVEKTAETLEKAEAALERMQWTDKMTTLEWESYELFEVKEV